MTPESSDDHIRGILQRAAQDPAFFKLLMEDREAALQGCDLSPAEKALLTHADKDLLQKMIAQARRRPLVRAGIVLRVAGIAAASAAVGTCLILPATVSAGSRPSSSTEAKYTLDMISKAEEVYRNQYGVYGTLEDLAARDILDMPKDAGPYEFIVTVEGEKFTATAKHRTKPDSMPAFRVGPDKQVERIPEGK
jgi:hypothetical protein